MFIYGSVCPLNTNNNVGNILGPRNSVGKYKLVVKADFNENLVRQN